LNRGEDSAHQFKENFTGIDNLAVEISAFANTDGGKIIIGVSDRGKLTGLSQEDIHRLNQWISNATTSKIDKSIYVKTEILVCGGKRLMSIHVPRGNNKPYAVNRVDVWVKSGADKRRAPIEEVLRPAQSSGLYFADELEIDATIADFDKGFFQHRYKKYHQEGLEKSGISLEQLLTNLKLLKNDKLTLAGLLLFGKHPERARPQFVIKATHFAGIDISVQEFVDKQDIHGKLIEQFKEGRVFIKRNLRRGFWKYLKEPLPKPSPMPSCIAIITSARQYKFVCSMIVWRSTARVICPIRLQRKTSNSAFTWSAIRPSFPSWKRTRSSVIRAAAAAFHA
jgi:predicted HTH transcriptional regulator